MPDYMYMLESRLSAEQRAAMVRVQELAVETGVNVYLTGGAVRDLISGMPIRDMDFTVEGNPTRLARELEKSGARTVTEDEKLRSVEMTFTGDVDLSICAAREDVYARPGTRPEVRWSTIMEDLHRRDFSINAIALSLNAASRGLLLDPTNGLADLENREIRGLSIHTFTNQPVRLLRAIRYSARMEFQLSSRTSEWFDLALERQLQDTIPPADAGHELRQVAREDKAGAVLKAWEARGLLGAINPLLAKRHADYEMINRILRARDELASAGLQARLSAPITTAVLAKLKPREREEALERLGYRAAEISTILQIEEEADKAAKLLSGRKTAAPGDAFAALEKMPGDVLVFMMAESSDAKLTAKVRNYLHKWRPLRQGLPAVELDLEAIGLERGPKFDKIVQDVFQMQILGRARVPDDWKKVLRRLSGIKEVQKKPEEKKKPDDKLKKRLMGKKGAPAEVTSADAAAPPTGKQPKQTEAQAGAQGSTATKAGRPGSNAPSSASGSRTSGSTSRPTSRPGSDRASRAGSARPKTPARPAARPQAKKPRAGAKK